MRAVLPLLALAVALRAGEADLPRDVAAAHPQGKWKIRKADLYRHLARFWGGQPSAIGVLPEYMKLRLVEDEARRRKVTVTLAEVDRWLKALDARVQGSNPSQSLKEMRKRFGMRERDLMRRGRQWLLNEKVARAVLLEKDSTRRKDAPIGEDSVIFVIDDLFSKASKQTEDLPEGVVARIRGIDITDYEFGRALSFDLAWTEVLKALRGLILAEEVALLLGNRDPPAAEEMRVQKDWFLTFERNRLRRMPNAPRQITDDMVKQILAQRGLTLEKVSLNPEFRAQARAVGHFRRRLTEKDVKAFYDANRERYGDQLSVARILVGARAQNVPGVGRKIRTLQQGKATAEEIWQRLRGGRDFGELAVQRSEDPDAIRLNGGVVPFFITADRPDYADTWVQADRLRRGEISRPFFSRGRGYVIVKLLERKRAPSYEQLRSRVREDAGSRDYHVWRNKVTRAALVNKKLLEQE